MKKKKNEIKKLSFEKVSILELNQLQTIKGGGNDNTYSITDTKNPKQGNYSENC